LAEAQAQAGLLDEALETAKGLVHTEDYALTAVHIADACISAKRFDDALAILNSAEQVNPSEWLISHTRLAVSEAYREMGDEPAAKRLFDKVHEGGHVFKQSIGRYYGRFGMASDAAEWIATLESSEDKATALIGLANGILDREAQGK
jgi:hypothetical protein